MWVNVKFVFVLGLQHFNFKFVFVLGLQHFDFKFVFVSGLQHFAVEMFKKMNIAQVLPPSVPNPLPESYK
jgi:hypothetical protein